MPTAFEAYRNRYPHLALERTAGGVLTATFHTDGGGHVHTGAAHTEFTDAFGDIALDEANEVVILTGAGGYWYKSIDMSQVGDITTPEIWYKIVTESRRQLHNLLDIAVPVISVVQGPAHVHGEYAFSADVVLAATGATFADDAHIRNGLMPADGVQLLWPEVMGHHRFRAFQWLQQRIGAEEALRLGMVAEVLPAAELLPRAHAIAGELLKLPPLTRRYTRLMFTRRLQKLVNDVAFDMGLEGQTVVQSFRGRSMETR